MTFLKVGDTVEVKVLSIDEEHRKMSLSLKSGEKKTRTDSYTESI